jgi:hypothetical protein
MHNYFVRITKTGQIILVQALSDDILYQWLNYYIGKRNYDEVVKDPFDPHERIEVDV